VDVWDAATGRHLNAFEAATAASGGVDFSPDGALLAAASRDGSTRLWDVAGGRLLATVASRNLGAERVRFMPGGRHLAIGYEDGTIEVRDLDYFFRYAAGNAEHNLRLLRAAGESFPRADEVIAWSRRIIGSR
jgi:WD40 repeat protein